MQHCYVFALLGNLLVEITNHIFLIAYARLQINNAVGIGITHWLTAIGGW